MGIHHPEMWKRGKMCFYLLAIKLLALLCSLSTIVTIINNTMNLYRELFRKPYTFLQNQYFQSQITLIILDFTLNKMLSSTCKINSVYIQGYTFVYSTLQLGMANYNAFILFYH
ncbi:hypothetical protein QTP88_014758 [Uroleucon formosanum]